VNVSAVFCDSYRFEVVHPFAFTQSCKNLMLLQPVSGMISVIDLPIAASGVQPERRCAPAFHDAVRVLADDGIVGGFDNRSSPRGQLELESLLFVSACSGI
jgi:hypothetical protein